MYIAIYKKIANGKLRCLYDPWISDLVLCDNLEVVDYVGGRREVQSREMYIASWIKADVWQKPAQHCKAYPPIKNKLRYIHCKGSNQSILKEISPACSLEGLMLKLKLQYFGHLMQRADSFEKTLWERSREGEGDNRG